MRSIAAKFIFSIFVCAFAVAAVEIAARIMLPAPVADDAVEITPLHHVIRDPYYGYVFPSNAVHRAVKGFADGAICYDATYRTDGFGRRVVQPNDSGKAEHLVLFGGSVTFGEGLNDSDTLAYHLSQRLPDYKLFNYALHGYGPSHMLARLQSETFEDQIDSEAGVAVYILIPLHVSRVIGDTRAFWIYDSPYYRLDSHGKLIRDGSFITGRPLITKFFTYFLKLKKYSRFLTHVEANIPIRLRKKDAELAARVLVESARKYKKQFPRRFVVLFHPTWDRNAAENKILYDTIRSALDEAGIEALDYSPYAMTDEDVIGPSCDRHPSGVLNQKLASWIARDLQSAP